MWGAALLLMSCGGGSGQTGDGGGGRAGSGAAGGVGGQTVGTGGAGAGCVTVSPCGGNIVGTWKVTQSCLTATQDLTSVCTGATVNIEYMFSGTVTYNADGTYSQAIEGRGTYHEHFPSGCTPFGYTCDQLGRVAVDSGISDSCSIDAVGGCNCDAVNPLTSTAASGTYAISGSTLTSTHDGMTSSGPYCVQGGVLHEMPGQGDGGVTSMGDIVLTKQ